MNVFGMISRFLFFKNVDRNVKFIFSPMLLTNFHEVRTYAKWDKNVVCLSYYKKESDVPINKNDKYRGIGYIEYNLNKGQICLISLTEEFRGRTLGRQMLDMAIKDMKKENIEEV